MEAEGRELSFGGHSEGCRELNHFGQKERDEAVLLDRVAAAGELGERRLLFSGVIYPGAGEGPLSSTLQLKPTVLLLGPMFFGPLSHPPYCSSCQLQN